MVQDVFKKIQDGSEMDQDGAKMASRESQQRSRRRARLDVLVVALLDPRDPIFYLIF